MFAAAPSASTWLIPAGVILNRDLSTIHPVDLNNPDEIQGGGAAEGQSWRYVSLYVPAAQLADRLVWLEAGVVQAQARKGEPMFDVLLQRLRPD